MCIFSYMEKICNVFASEKKQATNSRLWKLFIEKESERLYIRMYVVVVLACGFMGDFHFLTKSCIDWIYNNEDALLL